MKLPRSFLASLVLHIGFFHQLINDQSPRTRVERSLSIAPPTPKGSGRHANEPEAACIPKQTSGLRPVRIKGPPKKPLFHSCV